MKQHSKGRFRSYCLDDFRPTNHLDFAISGPLTGHWLFPTSRESTAHDDTKPEWGLDFEVVYHHTIDDKFLQVEKEYMRGASDYINGEPRLWAAEPLARGTALCSSKVRGCSQGIPANPPMLLPSFTVRVDSSRTKKIAEEVSPDQWPAFDSEDLDTALGSLDGVELDIKNSLKTMTNSEDG